jgi:ADYC domain
MLRSILLCGAALLAPACASEVQTSIATQADMPLQGTQLQGMPLLGTQLQNMKMVGFQFSGATLNGSALVNVRIEHGELVAEQNGSTLHNTALNNAHLIAQVHTNTNPDTTATVEYKIDAVATELSTWDHLMTEQTYIYTLSQNVDGTGTYQTACNADYDGNHVAIPIAATWNEHGDRVESSTLFTFGCTTGVIAKCYRWGYRPWVTGYGDLVTAHQICTRMARADYCGNGTSHTHENTMINAWDNLPSPGPIMHHTTTPTGMTFEAGWSTSGAVCLSHARWLDGGLVIAVPCPTRLIPPLALGATVCDLESQVLGGSAARLYEESDLNANLDVL